MSFASYKSPFDEALSKPLISENDTQSVTTTSTSASSRTNQSSKSGRGTKNNLASMFGKSSSTSSASASASSSTSASSSAVYSKKLTGLGNNNQTNNLRPPPPNSFSNVDHYGNESQDYQPPHLSLETTMEQPRRDTLEAALLRERNEESRAILQKMNTISAISSELNSLVESQQDNVDEVEDNAYGVHDAAERGVAELESANAMMRKNNGSGVEVFWKNFFAVIAVGGLVIAFVIFLHSI
jgi:hypothetical protein